MTAPRLPLWAALLASLALALLVAPLAAAAEPGDAGATTSTTADPVDAQGPLDLAEVTVG